MPRAGQVAGLDLERQGEDGVGRDVVGVAGLVGPDAGVREDALRLSDTVAFGERGALEVCELLAELLGELLFDRKEAVLEHLHQGPGQVVRLMDRDPLEAVLEARRLGPLADLRDPRRRPGSRLLWLVERVLIDRPDLGDCRMGLKSVMPLTISREYSGGAR